jgi:prephenate dehydrogenase
MADLTGADPTGATPTGATPTGATPTGATGGYGEQRRAVVVGMGLIGGSVGKALRQKGWRVTGRDLDVTRSARAMELGVIDAVGNDPDAELTFVATPVSATAGAVREALATTRGLVTDVGSVKAEIANAVDDPRFVGGHPMAGSELEGVEGADPDMFTGAVWVLTPTAATSDATFAAVAAVVKSLGADVVSLKPERHDGLVAVVSHVPHLTAATLMTLASSRAEEHAALLRLAAGGFRDMTRIASGHPAIWPDICAQNRDAIVETLDGLIEGLARMREVVGAGDRAALLATLERARSARANLPSRVARIEELAEVRIPVPDRPGSLAEVTQLAARLGVNVADLEISHSSEGDRGVLILLIEAGMSELFRGGLMALGYRPSVRQLS